MGVKKQP